MTVQTAIATATANVRSLSHTQKALWLTAQMSPESAAYNVYATVRIPAALDLAAWQTAWETVVARHEVLRSTYTTNETGEPIAIVEDEAILDAAVTNTSALSEAQLQTQIVAESDRPFDLETDSALRVRLYKKSETEYYQLVVLHEIAGELRSIEILLQEFRRAYANALKPSATLAIAA